VINTAAITVYIVLAILVATMGSNRRIGVLGFFILALLFTPPVMLLVSIATRPKRAIQRPGTQNR